jgi:putative transposase
MDSLVRHRHLPHWDIPGATYFITSCLAGSIPAKGLLDIERYRRELERRPCPPDLTSEEWEYRREKLIFSRTDHWLDTEPAVRHLADPRLAKAIVDSLIHFAEERYDLMSFVVMPSHFHWVFRPREEWVQSLGAAAEIRRPRERIMHSVKTFTARSCNELLGLTGQFWQQESFDHCVRDYDELLRIIEYVELNPVRAGLAKEAGHWLLSSARLRSKIGIRFGEAICKNHLL